MSDIGKRALERYKEKKLEETLVAHIKKHGGDFSDWYCGITDNVKRRLKEHESKFAVKLPYSVECDSMESAVAVEKSMHIKKCAGGDGVGNPIPSTKHVYVFKKK